MLQGRVWGYIRGTFTGNAKRYYIAKDMQDMLQGVLRS